MGGRLFLGGGGSDDDERTLWQGWAVAGARVVYWPFALEPSAYEDGLAWYRRALGRDIDVAMWRDLDDHAPVDLGRADVLVVGGGNTYALLDHVRSRGWEEPVREWVAGGGTYYGGSAGAVLAGEDIDVARFADPNDVGLTDTTGLRLVPGLLLRPHYGRRDLEELRLWHDRTGFTVVGLPERGGAVVDGGVLTNPGDDDVAVVAPHAEQVLRAGESFRLQRSG